MKKLFVNIFFLLTVSIYAQERTIEGVVRDAYDVLPGASIYIKNTTIGTVSSFDGSFSLYTSDSSSTIIISLVGYKTKEIDISKVSDLNIVLKEDLLSLDEVIVVGYGSSKKSDITGSISSIETSEIDKQTNPNVSMYLQGKVTGVQVVENSGAPGAGVDVQIRGANSINASSKPLYVIDGMPFQPDGVSDLNDTYAGGFVSSPMANINPNDIESIEILKDASATAIYGARGANGVVLITTKSGKTGKVKVNVSYAQSVARVAKRIELLNGVQYAELANEASEYRYGVDKIPFTSEELENLINIDHQNEVYQLGSTRDINLSISGGSLKNKYYVSGQYYDQVGVFPGTGFKKANVNINIEQEISKKITFNSNAKIFNSIANGSLIGGFSGGLIRNTLSWVPTAPMVRDDGTYVYQNGYFLDNNGNVKERYKESGESDDQYLTNPLSILYDYESKNTTDQILFNTGFTFKINDNLKMNFKYGYSNYKTFLQSYRATNVLLVGSNEQGYANIGHSRSIRSLYETTFRFKQSYGKHTVNGVLGLSGEKGVKEMSKASAWGFLQDITGYNDIGAATAPQPTVSGYYDNSLASLLARVNYSFKYKYYATVSARYDGSSKFAKGRKWGFFPSIGLSWRVHKEDFMGNIGVVSEMKLRGSTGLTGNQSIASYQTLGQYFSQEHPGKTNFNFNNNVNIGYAPVRIQNEDLTWEETLQTNFGLDLGLFNNRLFLVADAYQKNTMNLLYNIDVPSTTGFSSMLANIGEMQNRGLELALTTHIFKRKDFELSLSGNISMNENTVKKLSGKIDEQFVAGSVFGKPISILKEGSPVGEFYGYKMDGIWSEEDILNKPLTFMPDANPGDRRFLDVNNDGVLNSEDRVVIGSSAPKYFGGATFTARYRNWQFYSSFTFSYGNQMFNELKRYTLSLHGGTNVLTDALNRWRPITDEMTPKEREDQLALNATTNIPRAGNYSQTQEVSDAYIEDASFLRCNNLSVSYNLPKDVTDNLLIDNIRVSMSVENLFTISKYSGYSPVGNSRGGLIRGVDAGLYPTQQTFKFSILANL